MRQLGSLKERAAALVIILAFVVILSGLVVAYLARSTADRKLAHGSFHDVKADELAKSGIATIVASLKEEITQGTPITNSNIGPQRSPKPALNTFPAITNLIRRSVRVDGIPAPAVQSMASSVNTADLSSNGRSISLSRWNSNYMFPKANTGDDKPEPITSGFAGPNFWSPDWVIVTRNGPAVFSAWNSALSNSDPSNSTFAIGRYAFAIFDEGGQLDANVVVLPSPTPSVTDLGRKGVPALADLTAIKYTAAGTTATAKTLSKLVGWRNYATLQSSGTFPNLSPTPDPSPFMSYVLEPTRDFKTVATTNYLNHTDQSFSSRRQLIEYFRSSGLTFNLLQFLGTFSREKNIPTFKPGTVALTQRFPLSRLSLIKAPADSALVADIQKYFGLVWTDGTPGIAPPTPAIPGHWQYFGATGASLQSVIPALTTEPEFFQLLNYGRYSLEADDASHIAATLSLGAAIIDQYDDDTSSDPLTLSTTTMIEYSGGWAVGAETVDPARSPTPPPAGMSPTPRPTVTPYPMLNRPFRNVGEFGYAYKGPTTETLDFYTASSVDGPLLDLFTYNTAPVRAGMVNLNTANPAVIAALIKSTVTAEPSASPAGPAAANNAAASPTPNPTSGVIGNPTLGTLNNPALGRADIARLTAAAGNAMGSSTSEEQKETVARALAEVTQTRTWVLFVDVIAQSGRYPPTAVALKDFVVEGEKRYWLHIAIDRFTGEVVDQQLEEAFE